MERANNRCHAFPPAAAALVSAADAGVAELQRISDPVEVARGIVYLLVDATYSTGITLCADGGQSVP